MSCPLIIIERGQLPPCPPIPTHLVALVFGQPYYRSCLLYTVSSVRLSSVTFCILAKRYVLARNCHHMSYYNGKMHQIRFQLELYPRPRWGSLQRSPYPLSGLRGPTSKGREGRVRKGKGKEGEEKREEEEGERGNGREGKKVGTPHFLDESHAPGHYVCQQCAPCSETARPLAQQTLKQDFMFSECSKCTELGQLIVRITIEIAATDAIL